MTRGVVNIVFHLYVIIYYLFGYVYSFQFESTLGHIKPSASSKVQADAVTNLIKRLIPDRAEQFAIEVDPNISKKDAFHIEKFSNTSVVKIVGTTGVTAASGLHYYLKYYCYCHVSWEAQQLNIPPVLPEINITITLNDRFRYYQNVCTTSYSFVWWNWTQWEKHIDWMALNSFNLVLAFNGQEAIWNRVYQQMGLTEQEISENFGGPAFLSWTRMGNIRGWGGPLTASWHNRSLILQKQILNRMRELGIIPVLPAFAGYVPRAFKRIYPNASFIQVGTWNHFNDTYCCPYLVDPTENLFKIVGNAFIKELITEFGTDHVYNCDTFNEILPFTTDLTYLSSIGKAVYASMTEVDPKAIWLLQGWMFYSARTFWTEDRVKSLLHSVPLGKMIVLDLQSEQFPQYQRLEQYFGQPYIWCMLHNFGGTLGMFGSADKVNLGPFAARSMQNSTMIGTGVTPEGINQNYVIYDLMSEMAWRDMPVCLTEWFANYTKRRYGQEENNTVEAWQTLKGSVYNFNGIERIRGKYAITVTPRLNIKTWLWYDSCDLLYSWDLFLKAGDTLKNSPGYLHDLVDLTRQVLQVLGDKYYKEMMSNFKNKDLNGFIDSSKLMLQLFDDLESILSTNEAFLLGCWLNSAKQCATNNEELMLYEYNARNQITLWGPDGQIKDYANKQWAGIVSQYFKPRWSTFISYMIHSLSNKTPFNESLVRTIIFEKVERPFTFDRSEFPAKPTGDTIETAREIHRRWWEKGMMNSRFERSSEEFLNNEDEQEEENYLYFSEQLPKVTVLT